MDLFFLNIGIGWKNWSMRLRSCFDLSCIQAFLSMPPTAVYAGVLLGTNLEGLFCSKVSYEQKCRLLLVCGISPPKTFSGWAFSGSLQKSPDLSSEYSSSSTCKQRRSAISCCLARTFSDCFAFRLFSLDFEDTFDLNSISLTLGADVV